MATISIDTFLNTYKPIQNHLDDNACWDGCMFETYGAELQCVKDAEPNHVWTIIHNDENDDVDVINGYHLINRIGYLITENPSPDDFIVVKDD